MARRWLIDCKGSATKVKNAVPVYQIKDCEANRECPICRHRIDDSDASHEFPGFPAGVKFDPSDKELIQHLAAKCGLGNLEPHKFIDEFIPTVDHLEGICYTHPENLPGVKKDGSSVHFFHRTINAYATGQRKRRRIHNEHSLVEVDLRWHKTGKTKPVMENGVQKGCKKIMVLYRTTRKGYKASKSNWVMHQYHLGIDEDEVQGQYVVSKIFYQQQKKGDNLETSSHVIKDSDEEIVQTGPHTPETNAPNHPWTGKSVSCDDYVPKSSPKLKDELEAPTWLAGKSQAVDGSTGADGSFLCDEVYSSYTGLDDLTNDVTEGDGNVPACGIAELENLELDTPPDFQLPDLQFSSQDSILGWLD